MLAGGNGFEERSWLCAPNEGLRLSWLLVGDGGIAIGAFPTGGGCEII